MTETPTMESFLEEHPEWRVCPEFVLVPPTAEELAEDWPELDYDFLSKSHQLMNPGVTRGATYVQMRLNGNKHKFAEMIASQRGPGVETDATFFEGHTMLYDQFGSQKHLNRLLKNAKAHGHTPSPHSKYFPGLARFQGDPEAFVSRSQGRSYIKKLCEKRGWACEGAVNVAHREPDSDPLDRKNCTALGEDIIQGRAQQMMQADPSLKKMSRKDLRKQIIEKHGPSK